MICVLSGVNDRRAPRGYGRRMWTVTKEFRFEAAHALPHLPEGHKCRELHGHSYRFRVEVAGVPDERGFVIDYAEISRAVEPVVQRLDHRNLNEVFDFPTSCENLAAWIHAALKPELPGLARVVVFETPTTSVIYEP